MTNRHEGAGDSPERGAATPAGPLSAEAARGARVLAGAVLALGLLVAVVAVARPAFNLALDQAQVPVTVADPAVVVIEDPQELPPDSRLELTGTGSVELVVTGLPGWLRALTGLGTAIGGVLLGVGAWLVRSMLLLVAAGRAFDRRMPGRLRGLALVVLAGSILPPAVDGLGATFVTNFLGGLPDGGRLGISLFELELVSLLVVALLAIAAQVFESGRRLTEELEGLV